MSFLIRFRVRSASGDEWHVVAEPMDRRGVRRRQGLAPGEGQRETRPQVFGRREDAEREKLKLEVVQGQQVEFQIQPYYGGEHGSAF